MGDPGSSPGFGRLLWRREWQSTSVLLPGKSHGQRSLLGYSLWGHKDSDTTEWLHIHFHAESILGSIKVKLIKCWAVSLRLCIFHFWKCVTQGIKSPFENKATDPFHLSWVSPCHSFFLPLFFSGRSPGTQRLSEFTFLPGLLRPNWEGALCLHSGERSLCVFAPSRGRLEEVPCQGLYWLSF